MNQRTEQVRVGGVNSIAPQTALFHVPSSLLKLFSAEVNLQMSVMRITSDWQCTVQYIVDECQLLHRKCCALIIAGHFAWETFSTMPGVGGGKELQLSLIHI